MSLSGICYMICFQVWAFLAADFLSRFSDAGFFTIDQDYAMHDLHLTLEETGQAGAIYGGVSVVGTVLVTVSHALKLKYNKLICHSVSAILKAVSLLVVAAATDKVSSIILCLLDLGSWALNTRQRRTEVDVLLFLDHFVF